MVAVHLAGAVAALKLADDALGVALDALAPIDLEERQPAGVGKLRSHRVSGIRGRGCSTGNCSPASPRCRPFSTCTHAGAGLHPEAG